jgi:hypothetical protein
MYIILVGIVIALVLGLASGAGMLLSREPVYRAQPMDSVRVGNPGHNLVGPGWTGDVPIHQDPDGETAGHAQARGG